jgi:hypothetical protein
MMQTLVQIFSSFYISIIAVFFVCIGVQTQPGSATKKILVAYFLQTAKGLRGHKSEESR